MPALGAVQFAKMSCTNLNNKKCAFEKVIKSKNR